MPALATGQRIERYQIIRWLGSGATGESYEVEDSMLHRKVTLKLIHQTAMLPDATRRQFFREMQSVSILNHPYLAQVLDYGEFDGKLYVARRYVNNGSLLSYNGRVWFKAPLDVFDAIHYGHQLAQALQYIHNRGLLHGALTMSNILVLQDPTSENKRENTPFLLVDAGLAHFARCSTEKKSAPLPITAAPEQLNKRIIPASDQFSLAVLLYFWLTGSPPFIGTSEEIKHLKLTETITPLSSFNPNITGEQDRVVLRALSVSPGDRFQSVQSFADALMLTLSPKTQPVFMMGTGDSLVSNDLNLSGPTPHLPDDHSTEVTSHIEPVIENNLIEAEDAGITAHLIIFSPYTQEPTIVELRGKEITIGRAGSSDILLDRDDFTSRHHALLKRENDHFLIFDRRSAKGIQVNGLPIQSDKGYPLIDGDHLKIGNYELTFRAVIHTNMDEVNRSLASTAEI